MNPQLLFYLIIGILLFQFIFDLILDYLNYRRFDAPLPALLRDLYDRQEYQKSQHYHKARYRFGVFSSSLSLVALLGFLFLEGFAWTDALARSMADNEIAVSLLFFAILFLAGEVLSLPLSYYSTFVIEEDFGFNKTSKGTFFLDKIKGLFLGLLLGGVLLAVIIWCYQISGSQFWWYSWLAVAAFMIFLNMFYSRLIVPLFNKQNPLEESSLRRKLQHYAQKQGFSLDKIFVIDGSRRSTKANAYFSGFGKEKRVTLYDTLLKDLSEEEVVAVLAHEVGHYKKHHILINLIIGIGTTGLTLWVLSLLINSPTLSAALGVADPSFHIGLVAFGMLYSPISEVTGILGNALSRKFEFEADEFAAASYSSTALAQGLKKLSKNNLSNLTPHPAYVFVHYSHPPLDQRLSRLTAK